MLTLAFLLPFLIGFTIASICFKRKGVGVGILKCSLGIGLGIGICSLLYFLLRPINPSSWVIVIVELVILLSAIIIFYLSKDLKARFFYRGIDDWSRMFSTIIEKSHPDYPLLLPSFIARTWLYLQHETLYVPICVAGLFALAIVGLLTVSITLLRDKMQGYLAGLFLLSTPFFIVLAATQYADVPLSFFILSVTVLLTFAEQSDEGSKSLYMLAGIMGGLAAWTKNEGLLFVVAAVSSRMIVVAYMGGWKKEGKRINYFIVGLVPVLFVLIYFKLHFAPVNDLVGGQSLSTFQKLTSPHRYLQVIHGFMIKSMSFGRWIGSPAILLIVYALLFGAHSGHAKSGIANALAIAITLLGYSFVYIVTPYDLTWHINTSIDRLLFQLFPSMLFSYFMAIASPTYGLAIKEENPVLQ
ncbi:MAG: hypothetical protein EOO61_07865 [Hymenobacter sp.]|nr:MAG: hypothetical protein EOO61_07865 [Hymenobacter sp.]